LTLEVAPCGFVRGSKLKHEKNNKPYQQREITMMRINHILAVAGLGIALGLGATNTMAQNNGGQGGGGGGGGGRFNRGNFDPAQMQQRRLDNLKEALDVKDDAEWKALEPLFTKVMDAQREVAADRMRGAFGRGGRGGQGQDQGGGGGGGGNFRGGFGGNPSPEAEALQKAIDSKASNAELKAALAKFLEARKAKQAELEKAQADLRKVLTVRQEAIVTAQGLL
jgi:hypothetical protein